MLDGNRSAHTVVPWLASGRSTTFHSSLRSLYIPLINPILSLRQNSRNAKTL